MVGCCGLRLNDCAGTVIVDYHFYYLQKKVYERNSWICGSDSLKNLFCFHCLLFAKLKTIDEQKLELLIWDTCLKESKIMNNPCPC